MNLQLFRYTRGEDYSVDIAVNDGALAYSNLKVPVGTENAIKEKLYEEAETAVLKQLEEADETKSSAV